MQSFRVARSVRALAAAMLATSIVGLGVLSASPAQAANNSRVSISDVRLQRQTNTAGTPACTTGAATSGDHVCISWKWDATNAAPKANDDFFLEVPGNIAPDPRSFSALTVSYLNPQGAQVQREVGTCAMRIPASVFPNRIKCSFNPAVADLTKAGIPISGTGFAVAKIYRKDATSTTSFNLNGKETAVSYPGNSPVLPSHNAAYVPRSEHIATSSIGPKTTAFTWGIFLNSDLTFDTWYGAGWFGSGFR